MLGEKLETVDPGFGVESVWLAAPLTAPLGARQTLSSLMAPSGVQELASLVDTLLNRLGADRVFANEAVESDIPERAVRRVAALREGGVKSWPAGLPRPARLLHPPRAVEAVALLPDHPPVQFTWRKKAHRVRRADGPERVFGEWWRADDEFFAVRDYFQVEDEEGRRFWLFRQGDGQDGGTGDMGWYVHGMFG